MTESEKAAFLFSQSAAALIEAMGMFSENMQRQSLGYSMAYNEEAFLNVIKVNRISHNDALAYLKD
jgi:hypothetical protein